MFKKTGSKIKFQGMFSMVSESEVTERKDDPMCEHNKVNHDGIFKKVSFNDGSKRLDREGDLSPFPYIPKEKLKMIKSKTKVENLPRQIPLWRAKIYEWVDSTLSTWLILMFYKPYDEIYSHLILRYLSPALYLILHNFDIAIN